MNDTLKWVLFTLIAAITVFVGGESLGVDWVMIQVSILAFIKMIGLLLLIFSGSAAAIEVAKYFHRKNQLLEEEQKPSEVPQSVTERELQEWMRASIQEELATQQVGESAPHPTAKPLLTLEDEEQEEQRPSLAQRNNRQKHQ